MISREKLSDTSSIEEEQGIIPLNELGVVEDYIIYNVVCGYQSIKRVDFYIKLYYARYFCKCI
jgi:hypothetical protein